MSADYRAQALFPEGEETPSTTETPALAPRVMRQASDAAASSSVASSRLPPRRAIQRTSSIASSAVVQPATGASRHGMIVSAKPPPQQAKSASREETQDEWAAFSGHSSSYHSHDTDRKRGAARQNAREAPRGRALPADPVYSTDITAATPDAEVALPAERKPLPTPTRRDPPPEPEPEPEPSLSADTGDWVDSLDALPASPNKAAAVQEAVVVQDAKPIYGTVEGRARRASSCSNPSTAASKVTSSSPPPRPVESVVPPLSATALAAPKRATRESGATRRPQANAALASAAAKGTPRSTTTSRTGGGGGGGPGGSASTPRSSVAGRSQGSSIRPFELRTSSPQRASVARHQSELLRMELDKPVHRVPPHEMGRLMALPRASDTSLPTGMTRLDLAQEEDVKELFRQQYLVDPLMRKRPGKRQFYVPPQADIFGMYGIRDLPLEDGEGGDDDEARAAAEAEEEATMMEQPGAKPKWVADTAVENVSAASSSVGREPAQRSRRGGEFEEDVVVEEDGEEEEERQQESPVPTAMSDVSPESPEVQEEPQQLLEATTPTPASNSRQDLLERCAQRRLLREQQRQQQQQQRQQQQQPQPTLQSDRPSTAAISEVSGYSGFAPVASQGGGGEPSRPAATAVASSQPDRRDRVMPSAHSDAPTSITAATTVNSTRYSQDPRQQSQRQPQTSSRTAPARREHEQHVFEEPESVSDVAPAPAQHLTRPLRSSGMLMPRERTSAVEAANLPTPTRVIAVATAVVAEERAGGVSTAAPRYRVDTSASPDQTWDSDANDDSSQTQRRQQQQQQQQQRTPGRRGRPSIQPTAERTNLDHCWQPTLDADVSRNVDSGMEYRPSVRQRGTIARQYAEQPDNVHQRARPQSHRFTPQMVIQDSHGDHDIFGVSARVGQLAMDAAMRQYNEEIEHQRHQEEEQLQSVSSFSSARPAMLSAAAPLQSQQRQHQQRRGGGGDVDRHEDSLLSGSGSQYVMRRDEPQPYSSAPQPVREGARRVRGDVSDGASAQTRDEDRRSHATGVVESPASEAFSTDGVSLAEYELEAYVTDQMARAEAGAHGSVSSRRTNRDEDIASAHQSTGAAPPSKPHYLPYSQAPYAHTYVDPAGPRNGRREKRSASTAAPLPPPPPWSSSLGELSPIPYEEAAGTDVFPGGGGGAGDETSFLIRRVARDGSETQMCRFCGHSVEGEMMLAMSDGVVSRQISPEAHTGAAAMRRSRGGRQADVDRTREGIVETGPPALCRPRDHDIFLRHPATAADAPAPAGRRRSVSAGVGRQRRVPQSYDSSQVSGAFRWK